MSAIQAPTGIATRPARIGWLSRAALTLCLASPASAMEVLIIADTEGDGTAALQSALLGAGVGVTISPVPEYLYDGTNPAPNPYDVIIHLDGSSTYQDMTQAGQMALVQYVSNGGGFIHGQWNSYELAIGQMQYMRDLTLFDAQQPQHATEVMLTTVPGQEAHPVLANVPSPFSMVAAYNIGTIHDFAAQPAVVLMRDGQGNDAVAARDFGLGKVVGFHHAAYGSDSTTLGNVDVQRLYVNAVAWAGRKPVRPGVPSLSLIGGDTMTAESHAAFVDPGAMASDLEDGDLTSAIIVAGSVDVTVLGAYHLDYSVSDSDGHAARAVRWVTVVDTTPPMISLTGAATMTVGYGTVYADPGATAYDTQDGVLTSSISVSGTVDTRHAGTYVITYSVPDRSGNMGRAVRSVSVSMPPAPTVTCSVSKKQLGYSSNQLTDVGFSYSVSSLRPISTVTMSVTQDEALSNRTGDAMLKLSTVGTPKQLLLRSQRSSSGDGRIYLIRITVTDDLGRSATASCAVTVPKSDKKKRVASANAQAARALAAGVALPVNSLGTPLANG